MPTPASLTLVRASTSSSFPPAGPRFLQVTLGEQLGPQRSHCVWNSWSLGIPSHEAPPHGTLA